MVDQVNTLQPGENATVQANFDGNAIHFIFGIPRGADGQQGPPGPPGEVTESALAGAIAGTSANTNAVATLDTAFSDPPALADLEAIRAKLNELIMALRR